MQIDPSLMRLSLICAIGGAGLSSVPGLSAQGRAVSAEFTLERSAVVAGEPLVILATVQNGTERSVILPEGELVVDWTVKTEDGSVVCASERPHGDTASLARTVSPGGRFSFSVIAYETATIRQPGRYRLFAAYVPGIPTQEAPSRIAFEVLARDNAALAKRAQELHDKAVRRSSDWEANARAGRAAEELASMDYAGSRPLLCDVLKRNDAVMGSALRRLERDPDADTVGCFVEYFRGAAPSMARNAVESALKDILRDHSDPKLRSKILTVAGALSRDPNCLQLESGEPSQLVSYLDGPKGSQTSACTEYAIGQIGEKRYVAGVGVLARRLGFRREPDFWEKGEDVVGLQHEWYPATSALFQIGKPALPALIEILGTETTPIIRSSKALQTVMDISRDDFVSGVKLIRDAAATRKDKAAQARLVDAARKSVNLCRASIRPQCEAALR